MTVRTIKKILASRLPSREGKRDDRDAAKRERRRPRWRMTKSKFFYYFNSTFRDMHKAQESQVNMDHEQHRAMGYKCF